MSSEHQRSSRDIVISVGRSYLQMIAAAHVLLEREPFWTEALLLNLGAGALRAPAAEAA